MVHQSLNMLELSDKVPPSSLSDRFSRVNVLLGKVVSDTKKVVRSERLGIAEVVGIFHGERP